MHALICHALKISLLRVMVLDTAKSRRTHLREASKAVATADYSTALDHVLDGHDDYLESAKRRSVIYWYRKTAGLLADLGGKSPRLHTSLQASSAVPYDAVRGLARSWSAKGTIQAYDPSTGLGDVQSYLLPSLVFDFGMTSVRGEAAVGAKVNMRFQGGRLLVLDLIPC